MFDALEQDLPFLSRRVGDFVVRLHVLGDFVDIPYVQFWKDALNVYRHLHVFGYTHHKHGTPVGDAIAGLLGDRVAIRRSNAISSDDPMAIAQTRPRGIVALDTVVCPEQAGQTNSCLTCGLCCNNRTGITFWEH